MAGAENALSRETPGNSGDPGLGHSSERNNGAGGSDARGSEVVYRLQQETALALEIVAQTRCLVGDDEEMIETAIEGETDLREAIARAVARLSDLEALMSGCNELMQDLKKRFDRFADQHDRLRQMLAVALEATGAQRMELPQATLSLKRLPGKVTVTDEASLPMRFWKQAEPKLDRRALLDAMKDGELIPGATLSNGGSTIQVKFS